jgi:hypothetical protein
MGDVLHRPIRIHGLVYHLDVIFQPAGQRLARNGVVNMDVNVVREYLEREGFTGINFIKTIGEKLYFRALDEDNERIYIELEPVSDKVFVSTTKDFYFLSGEWTIYEVLYSDQ